MPAKFILQTWHWYEEENRWMDFLEHLQMNMKRNEDGLEPILSNGRKYKNLRNKYYQQWKLQNET